MKKILGLDLGSNSIGWALVQHDFAKREGKITGIGCRIIPMSQDILGKFDAGVSISQTAERTAYRSTRRLYQRDNLRRERLHRVLNILGFLPHHYQDSIDFDTHKGQFKEGVEVKLNYRQNSAGEYEFLFKDSFQEMVKEFEKSGTAVKVPFDWTIYYLRKKALTEKVTKEELAWLILNFNQKRGYYQLRGEEEEELADDKKKEFVVLDVARIADTGDIIKSSGNRLYEVYFTNGWKYDKPIVKTENWIGKSREFIVTTSVKKDGEIKRSYKAVDSEKDWLAIKTKTQQDIDNSGRTVGEYIFEALLKDPKQKIRGKLVKTIERKYYKSELKSIIKKQMEFHPELRDSILYEACIHELYGRNEAHRKNIKGKGFNYLFIDDIIFYQRPLKSKKSTIGECQYEYRTYYRKNEISGKEELVREPLKVIAKSHPLFQEFRLWQFLRNLKIYQKESEGQRKIKLDVDVTNLLLPNKEAQIELFDFLNTKKEIAQHQLLKYFSDKELIPKQARDNTGFRWNYVEDKKYPCNETRASFLSRLNKVKNLNPEAFLTREIEIHLWHIIYSVKDKIEYEQALKTFAKKYGIDRGSFFDNFKRFPPFTADYGSYSEKALKKLLPLMRIGKYWKANSISEEVKERVSRIMERLEEIDFDKAKIEEVNDDDIPKKLLKSFILFKNNSGLEGLNTYQACYAVYNRHSEAIAITQWSSPADITRFLNNFKQHSLRNPIVEQVVTETLRVVRDIWEVYGLSDNKFFDKIHLELGREIKNSADKRKKMTDRISENENTNFRIRALLKELNEDSKIKGDIRPYSPSHQEILKIYEEGVFQNPSVNYSGISETEVEKIRKNINPTRSELIKYKLWLEQGYISPYTGAVIPLSKLFTTDYEVEHIIPQSRYFDDSLSNKVICESAVNTLKDNKTAFEFISEHASQMVDLGGGQAVPVLSLFDYEEHCNRYFKKNRLKLKNLLIEEIPEGFINRQMNDSRYISKLVKGLLSNIVRDENEQEATSKNLIPVTGAITAKLKQDWGLNDKWNELIAPRFKRMNDLTNSSSFGFMDDHKKNGRPTGKKFFRIQVPDEISKGFSKKRIDHRHHPLDALIIACTSVNHINYLNALNAENRNYTLRESLLVKNRNGNFSRNFKAPWPNFATDAQDILEKTLISFKQNIRVINKTNNKTWQWREVDGKLKKVLVKQVNGDNWAIRKPLHKETVSGKIDIKVPEGKVATAARVSLSDIKNQKHIDKITDISIRKILENHLLNYSDHGAKRFVEAFSPDGIEELNKNIVSLNGGKPHQPVLKARLYEIGKKFKVGSSGNKSGKYVEAAKGTNLFFVVYLNPETGKRVFDTIPLNDVIEHQKQVAHLPKNERTPVPLNHTAGRYLFTLSPNDLVYIPNKEEQNSPAVVDFKNLSKDQVKRVYKMVSSTGAQCFFVQSHVSRPIQNKVEFSAMNKMEKDIHGTMIKEVCWKLYIDRLGRITGKVP